MRMLVFTSSCGDEEFMRFLQTQSAVMPLARMTFAHLAVSSLM